MASKKNQIKNFKEKGGFEVDTRMKEESIDDPITEVPPEDEMKVYMSQHLGPEAEVLVEKGSYVKYGEKIGGKEEQGMMLVPIHSPVTGTVKEIKRMKNPVTDEEEKTVVIRTESDEKEPTYTPMDPRDSTRDELIERVREAGIVGLGGAAFPTHVKLSEDGISHLLINAKESDPNLACDVRLMMEEPEMMIKGIKLMGHILDVKEIIFATRTEEGETPEFERLLREHGVKIIRVKPNYSVGSERLLVNEVIDKELPSGEFPPSIGTVVHNVATAYALAEAVLEGYSLVSRGMTFYTSATGGKNLWTRMGTSVEHIFDFMDVSPLRFDRVALGSIMMGPMVPDPSYPVLKATSGLTGLTPEEYDPYREQLPCIRCGYCNLVCPVDIYPQQIMQSEKKDDMKWLKRLNPRDCIDCGLCSYVCPSRIKLTPYLRRAQFRVDDRQ